MDGGDYILWLIGIIFVIVMTILIVDDIYFKSIAKDNANNHCMGMGFDQYKQMSRVGIWSINPVAIKCEYAERYTDLGVRANTN